MTKKILPYFIISSIFLTGCKDLFADPNFSKDKIKFKNEIVVNYLDEVDTTSFVESIDNIKIKDSNRNKDKNIITINNYIIECPKFVANKCGKNELIYKLGTHDYKCIVAVKDISGPEFVLEQDTYEITQFENFTLDNIKIKKLKDNLTKKKNIKLNLNGEYDTSKLGTYNLTLNAIDENKNSTSKDIILIVYPTPSLEINTHSINLKINETYNIAVSSQGKGSENITFSSSDNNIATVDCNGTITAKNSGSTTINIECNNGLSTTLTVNVEKETSNKTNNKNNSNNNADNDNNNSSTGSSLSNPSKYNKYFSGVSISIYNDAYNYAERILSEGKANGYTLMPDGKGYNVSFY